MRFAVSIGVLAGAFASQPLAFAHLLDAAPDADLDHVEVLRRPFGARLAHHFARGVAARIEAEAAGADTLVLLLPGCGIPFAATARLAALGRFPGHVTRALAEPG